MTTVLNRNLIFGAITRMGGPNPSPLIAVAGPRRTILHAQKTGEQVEFLGESPDLGGETLAVDNTFVPNFPVLTSVGVTMVDDSAAPQIVSQSFFDPGGGTWLGAFGGLLATPLAQGGVQVIDPVTGTQLSALPGIASDSRFAVACPYLDMLYVVDGKRAEIVAIHVNRDTGVATFVDRIRAPNCRDIIKVTLDDFGSTGPASWQLFVVCRNRVVRFTLPYPSGPVADFAVDLRIPAFAQDYGVSRVDYTDLVVMAENQYWVAQDYVTSPSPLGEFYGPTLGVWDSSIGSGEMFVAAPKGSIWTVNNVTPYYTTTTIPETITPPPVVPPVIPPVVPPVIPPVIAPLPPVITSALTASVAEDTLFSYTITATGTGPIYYDVVGAPGWVTSINHTTGVVLGMPTDPGTVNLTITATNAGGTDTETLVVTVTQDGGWMGGMAGLYDATTTTLGTLRFRYHKAAVGTDTLEVYLQTAFGPDLNFRCRLIAPDASVTTTTGNGLVSFSITQVGAYDVYIMERPRLYEYSLLNNVGTSTYRYRVNTGPFTETSRQANGAIWENTWTKAIGTGAGNTFTTVYNLVTEIYGEVSTALTHASFNATGAPFSGPVTNVATLQAQVGPGYFDGTPGSITVQWTGVKMGGVDMIGDGPNVQGFISRVDP